MSGLQQVPLEAIVGELDSRMGGLVDAYCEGLVTEREVVASYPAQDAGPVSLVLAWAKEVRAGHATWEELEATVAARLAQLGTGKPS